VLVSHLHGDHFGGLPFLVLDGQFRRRTEDLTVVGPVGTGTRLEQAMEALYPGSTGVRRRFDVHVVEHVGTSTLTPWRAIAIGSPAGTHLSATALASDLTSWQVAHDGLQLGV
jgi:ribonuclease BN (tRNA processing enzyme)